MPDPIANLQRLAALRASGRSLPRDLTDELLNWISGAAPLILNGTPPDEALGLKVSPGSRSLARTYRQSRRDVGLRNLYNLATGSQIERGETVLGWLDARLDDYPVPADALPYLDQVLAADLPIPGDGGSVARIARARAGRAHAVIDPDESETMKL